MILTYALNTAAQTPGQDEPSVYADTGVYDEEEDNGLTSDSGNTREQVSAQESLPAHMQVLDAETRDTLAARAAESAPCWETLSVSGRLRMDGLPLSPTVKIDMQRGEAVSISLRAPFVGEAARIYATRDSVTAVNKMGRTYCTMSLADANSPAGVDELQSLLLARVWLPGLGLFGPETAASTLLCGDEENILLLPVQVPESYSYGYVMARDGRPESAIVVVDDNTVTVEYGYKDNGATDMDVEAALGEHLYRARLELKRPEPSAAMPGVPEINSKYRRLTLEEFMKSF